MARMKETTKNETLHDLGVFGGFCDVEAEFSYYFTPEEPATRDYPGGGGDLIFRLTSVKPVGLEDGHEGFSFFELADLKGQQEAPGEMVVAELWATTEAAIEESINSDVKRYQWSATV